MTHLENLYNLLYVIKMKTIYSILSIPLNAALDEKISIGIVVKNGEKCYFKYSIDKLNAIKGILSPEKIHFIKNYLNALEGDINFKDFNTLFYEELSSAKNWINKSYILYLSKYSNNTIQFSTPSSVDIELDDDNFKWLFEKYVFKFESNIVDVENKRRDLNIVSKVKKYLYPTIENNVNIDITLNSSNFENLFAPIEVNFFGMNDVPVAGQAFDFEKKHYFLENDVTRYVSLTKALELEGKENGKYFVLGREPRKSNRKSHLMWEHIRDSDFLEFIDIDEIGIVEEYVKYHSVRPYFSKS